MNRRHRCLAVVWLLATAWQVNAQVATPSDQCAVTAFDRQSQRFFEAVSPGSLRELGLNSLSELQGLVAGKPYPIYKIIPDVILSDPSSEASEQSLTPTGLWQVPLRSGQQIRLFALVQQTHPDKCLLVSLGYGRLAKGFSRLIAAKALPVAERQGRLVQIPQALETLWLEGEGSDLRAFRLSAWEDDASTQKSRVDALTRGAALSDVLRQIEPVVRRNLNGG